MRFPQTRFVRLEEEGRILVLTITNPPHNYLPSGFFQDLAKALEVVEEGPFRAVIVTGEGRNFSKGADLNEIRTGSRLLNEETLAFGNGLFQHLAKLKKPTIAAIQGACFGGGLELALACHLRVCSQSARLGLPELTVGLIPGLGGIHRLIRVVGEAKALEMMLMGDLVSAEQALQIRLVHRIFCKKDFMKSVLLWTRTLLAAPDDAIEALLALVELSRSQDEKTWIDQAARKFLHLSRKVSSEGP